MDIRKSWLWLIAALPLVALVVPPVGTEAQCVVSTTNKQNFPPTVSVTKTLTAAGTCRTVGNNSALGCFPSAAPQNTTFLVAAASTMAADPSCSWQCTCGGITGTIVIDRDNGGLPVELMDFEVDGGEVAGLSGKDVAVDSLADTSGR